jgi:transposase InsO family protein
MPWKEESIMSLRREFVELASQSRVNISQLCRRFQISREIGYKWLKRYREEGVPGLADRSRRPEHSPRRTKAAVEQVVLSVRDRYNGYGARKIRRLLLDQGQSQVPTASTVHAILGRNGRIDPAESVKHQPWQRFEYEAPNQLWQMDFKGHFPLGNGQRCHPLTVLDDHSRYGLCLRACRDERGPTVQDGLRDCFRRYGLPERMLMDNGSPWGHDADHPYTLLTVWLLRLGIGVSHGRPYHPQTQGKAERFHRTMQGELLQGRSYWDHEQAQTGFNQWLEIYNFERPHQALSLAVPARHYQISPKPFPEVLPAIEYGPEDQVRKVQDQGWVCFHGREFRLSQAFRGYPVALRPTRTDGLWEVYFYSHKIAHFDLSHPSSPD